MFALHLSSKFKMLSLLRRSFQVSQKYFDDDGKSTNSYHGYLLFTKSIHTASSVIERKTYMSKSVRKYWDDLKRSNCKIQGITMEYGITKIS